MANQKISALTQLAGTAIVSADKIPIVDDSAGITKYFSPDALILQNNGTVTQATTFGTTVSFNSQVNVAGLLNNNLTSGNEAARFGAPIGQGVQISFLRNSSRRGFIQQTTSDELALVSEYGDIVFKSAATAGSDSDTEYVRLKAGGRLGIGTASPNSQLDVVGTVQMDALRIDQAPTAGAVTTTHYLSVNLNGTTYRIPVGTA